ncbi:MAG TPA: hypothetical protein VF824_08920 [Thermoanaerobaculia bacterium]
MTIDLSLERLFSSRDPVVTCGITVVGYRFYGTPGQRFVYAGEPFTIGSEGYVELLADRRRNFFTYERVRIPLERGATDPFGFVDVTLPQVAAKN